MFKLPTLTNPTVNVRQTFSLEMNVISHKCNDHKKYSSFTLNVEHNVYYIK